ncbi:MAG: hypothetical protein IIC97_07585 [Chloroflexi bacterium]|nr:hypothetical protein [Chloroflexota bacterium]
MLKYLVKGLLGRLLGYGTVVLGFWLLFSGFSEAGFTLVIVGCVSVLLGMYLLVIARRAGPILPADYLESDEEDDPSDSFVGSGESDKLPP